MIEQFKDLFCVKEFWQGFAWAIACGILLSGINWALIQVLL